MACPTCQVLDCSTPIDVQLYSLQSGLIFTNSTLSFVLGCPIGYVCHSSGYPITIVIPPGRIRLPVPPTRFPTTFAIVLSLRCCQSTLSRTVPTGSTQAQIEAIANAMILECAAQEAACDVITQPPCPGCPPPTPEDPPGGTTNVRVDLQNSAQTASKVCGAGMTGSISVTIPAGRFAAVLWNPTAAFVAAQQLVLNNWALSTAQTQVNAITPPSITDSSPLPSGAIGVAYSHDLSGSDGDPPYTFSIASGSLPNGLSMNSSTGLISGTPTMNGNSAFVVRITDSDGHACSKSFELTIGALCPVFITNITHATMNQPYLAVAAESLNKVLIAGNGGTLQIIETIAGVDTVVANNTYLAAGFGSLGVFEPNVSRFFIQGLVGPDDFILKINPTTGATESSAVEAPNGIGYNAARMSIFTLADIGGGFGIIEVNPTTMAASTEYVASGGSPGNAAYFGAANAIVILNEPSNTECSFINAGNYTFTASLDISIAFGGGNGTDQFANAAVACAGKMFIGIGIDPPGPGPNIGVKLAVLSAGATAITAVDLTPYVASANDVIEWMQANETLGIVIVKCAGRIIVVNATTLQVVCSFVTTSTSGEIFCVQPANSRIYIPRASSNDVSIYGH